jgi:hypothetical protein
MFHFGNSDRDNHGIVVALCAVAALILRRLLRDITRVPV